MKDLFYTEDLQALIVIDREGIHESLDERFYNAKDIEKEADLLESLTDKIQPAEGEVYYHPKADFMEAFKDSYMAIAKKDGKLYIMGRKDSPEVYQQIEEATVKMLSKSWDRVPAGGVFVSLSTDLDGVCLRVEHDNVDKGLIEAFKEVLSIVCESLQYFPPNIHGHLKGFDGGRIAELQKVADTFSEIILFAGLVTAEDCTYCIRDSLKEADKELLKACIESLQKTLAEIQ